MELVTHMEKRVREIQIFRFKALQPDSRSQIQEEWHSKYRDWWEATYRDVIEREKWDEKKSDEVFGEKGDVNSLSSEEIEMLINHPHKSYVESLFEKLNSRKMTLPLIALALSRHEISIDRIGDFDYEKMRLMVKRAWKIGAIKSEEEENSVMKMATDILSKKIPM